MGDEIKWATHFSQIDRVLEKHGDINDARLLTTVMSSYRRVRRADKALDAFHDAKRRRLALDEFTYSAAISACANDGQWGRALDLLDEMRQRGLAPDVFSYNAAISVCAKGGQWQRALDLLDVMLKRGLKPNPSRSLGATAARACPWRCIGCRESVLCVVGRVGRRDDGVYWRQQRDRKPASALVATACLALARQPRELVRDAMPSSPGALAAKCVGEGETFAIATAR